MDFFRFLINFLNIYQKHELLVVEINKLRNYTSSFCVLEGQNDEWAKSNTEVVKLLKDLDVNIVYFLLMEEYSYHKNLLFLCCFLGRKINAFLIYFEYILS